MRASGLKPGVPDVLIFTPTALAPKGVALELKAAKGALSPEQRVWLERLSGLGWATVVAYGYEDALQQLGTLGYRVG